MQTEIRHQIPSLSVVQTQFEFKCCKTYKSPKDFQFHSIKNDSIGPKPITIIISKNVLKNVNVINSTKKSQNQVFNTEKKEKRGRPKKDTTNNQPNVNQKTYNSVKKPENSSAKKKFVSEKPIFTNEKPVDSSSEKILGKKRKKGNEFSINNIVSNCFNDDSNRRVTRNFLKQMKK